jgi:2-polyprenyl-3-methyl-5-hydroxy-6-metoxy-1,4-benzoquinol methylase
VNHFKEFDLMAIKNIDRADYQELYDLIGGNPLIQWYQHAIKYKFVIPIFKYAKPDESILDVGCARGAFIATILKNGYGNVTGLDVENALPFEIEKHVRFYKESIYNPELNMPQFDHVHMASVLHHLPMAEMPQVAANLAKLVKPSLDGGGYLYIYDVNRRSLPGKIHNNIILRLTNRQIYLANEYERPEHEAFGREWDGFVQSLSRDFDIIKRSDFSIYVSLVARRK